MRLRFGAALACAGLALVATRETARPQIPGPEQAPRPPARLEAPEVILDGSEHGARLFPQFADFDGDGLIDLVLGVGDRLLVHRNRGTNARPVYEKPTWFDDAEPSARLPEG